MNMKVIAFLAAACAAGTSALAETWVFTEASDKGDSNYWSRQERWTSQEGGTNGVPQTGDCLELLAKPKNMHRAELGRYMKRIHFGSSGGQNVAHSGFYLQGQESGGEGFVWDSASSSCFWCGFWMDGTVPINIGSSSATPNSCYFRGRDASHPGRFIKLGAGGLSTAGDATFANWRGGIIREGALNNNSTKGMPADLDFYFDGTAASAKLTLAGRSEDWVNGYLHSSTNELPVTNHGVSDDSKSFTLTISGASPVDEQYYEGSFMGTLSFCWNPSDATKRFTIARSTSTTKGSLIVKNGTLAVTNGASFTALDSVRMEGSGVFEPASDAGTVNAAGIAFAGNGRIRLAEGQTFTVRNMTTNGVTIPFGTYTAANCPWILGAGTLDVNAYVDAVDPIILTVESGEQTLEDALTAYNAAHAGEAGFVDVTISTLNGGAHKTRSLVKKGLGKLKLMTAIANYEGAVYVDTGVLYTDCRYALGKENNDNAPVYVRDGATFHTATTSNVLNSNRTFHIAGSGAEGYGGALYCIYDQSGTYGNQGCFGKAILLDADATACVGSWMYVGKKDGYLSLNGHTFTLRGNGIADDLPMFLPQTIRGDGHIVVLNGQWSKAATTTFTGTSPENSVTFGNQGGFRFADKREVGTAGVGAKTWKWIFNGPNSNVYTDYNLHPRDDNYNVLDMSFELDTMIRFWFQSDRRRGYLLVKTPVSGTGGFASTGNRTIFLHLLCPGNTFRGGLDFTRGTIWAYPNGAIPNGPAAGKVKLAPTDPPYDLTVIKDDGTVNVERTFHNTFDGVAFMTPEIYELPDLEASGTFPSRVQGGQGAWRKIVQKGKGLDYYSGVGAPLLDVQAGYVKLPRGAAPGLWEGTNVCADAAAASTAYAGTVCKTNLALRGPTAIIPKIAYNYTGWKANEVITYKGYVWNRTADAATWTFALAPKAGSAKILVDGTVVVEGSGEAPTAGNVTLTPGAHDFECRLLNASGARAASATWPDLFGCAYDPQGRNDLANTNSFRLCVDPGDGSLFTRTTDTAANLPVFEKIALAAGASLDLNGNAFTAVDLAGAGAVTNTATDALSAPQLTLSGRLTVNAGANETLKIAVPVVLGDAFRVSVTNTANRLRGKHTVFTATEAITGKTANIPVDTDGDDGLWVAKVSADGKSLEVQRSGLMILLR